MELPALQGVMGREFARLDGEPEAVANALFEQYLPRFAGDTLPQGRIGTALALADRADTLVGYLRFVGAEPKGSSDPFGLKRATSAIVDLLARDRTLPTASALLAAAERAFLAQGLTPAKKPVDPMALLEARLRGLLEERGARYDLIDALLSAPWDNIASVVARAKALDALLSSDEEIQVANAATRVRNILRGVEEVPKEAPDRTLLTTPEERALLAFLQTVGPQVERALQNGDYTDALDTLAALSAPIDRLFDHVLILTDDPDVRTARLALLAMADRLYLRLADFSKLVTE
jgi:glycyl-tRNA synthetase beta chain